MMRTETRPTITEIIINRARAEQVNNIFNDWIELHSGEVPISQGIGADCSLVSKLIENGELFKHDLSWEKFQNRLPFPLTERQIKFFTGKVGINNHTSYSLEERIRSLQNLARRVLIEMAVYEILKNIYPYQDSNIQLRGNIFDGDKGLIVTIGRRTIVVYLNDETGGDNNHDKVILSNEFVKRIDDFVAGKCSWSDIVTFEGFDILRPGSY